MAEAPSDSHEPTLEEIDAVISSEDMTKFVGFEETTNFEVRSRAYNVDAPDKIESSKARQQLAFDLTSIMNSGGGYLVLGLKTATRTGSRKEYVIDTDYVKHDAVDIDRWRTILREHTIPNIQIDTTEYGYVGEAEGVWWFKLPDAKQLGMYPILVRKAKWDVDDTSELKGEMFALYHRDGAENIIKSAENIQMVLSQNSGANDSAEQIALAQFQLLNDKLDRINTRSTSTSLKAREITDRISTAEASIESSHGTFYIYARPNGPYHPLKNFWDNKFIPYSGKTERENIFSYIKEPSNLRPYGWGVNSAISDYPEPTGNSWVIRNGSGKYLEVSSSAEVLAVVSVGSFLSAGQSQVLAGGDDETVLVNELALTEYLYNYMDFLSGIASQFKMSPNFTVVCGFRFPPKEVVGLLTSEAMGPTFFYSKYGKLDKTREWNYDRLPDSPVEAAARITIDIVRGGFGVTHDNLPLRTDYKGDKIVDADFYLRKLK